MVQAITVKGEDNMCHLHCHVITFSYPSLSDSSKENSSTLVDNKHETDMLADRLCNMVITDDGKERHSPMEKMLKDDIQQHMEVHPGSFQTSIVDAPKRDKSNDSVGKNCPFTPHNYYTQMYVYKGMVELISNGGLLTLKGNIQRWP